MKYLAVKIFWFFGNPIKKFYHIVFRPKTRGVKCLVEKEGKFLLVKLNYAHRKWSIPGGKVERKESFKNAALREIKEETGIGVKNPVLIGSYKSTKQYKNEIVEVYLGNSDTLEIKIDPVEIEKAGWFYKNEFPESYAGSVDKILNFYDEYKNQK